MRLDAVFASAGHLLPHPRWHIGAHAHRNHELVALVRGRMRIAIHGRIEQAVAGDVLWYPAGTVHEEWADPTDPVESYFVEVAWPGWPGDGWPLRARDAHGVLRQLIVWLYEERLADGTTGRLRADAFVRALVAEWWSRSRDHGSGLGAQVRERLRGRLGEPVSLGDLAREAGLSRFHFARAFKSETGRTPLEEVRRLRLAEARGLLMTTDLPVETVAARCGLGNARLLARWFARTYGLSPRQVRRSSHRGAVR
ncbi:MAG: hypothetical protein RLZZ127_564 [Planctomycetota bacterium]|jgi:AraC-like DNA-binding protein/mannose-6-phosphate isomerase-like protein (cupin superfamily)